MNDLLGSAWQKFAAALSTGEVLELEPDYESWVAKALDAAVTIKPVPDEVA